MSTPNDTTDYPSVDELPSQAFSLIPLHVGSAVIKAVDKGQLRAQALEGMHAQAAQQIDMLRQQAALLMEQAAAIEKRVRIAQFIYAADVSFVPTLYETYHLYERATGKRLLSLVAPGEWGRSKSTLTHLATVRLLADRTWEVLAAGDAMADELR